MSKTEKKDALFAESGGVCIVCGRPREEASDWAMAQIIPDKAKGGVSLSGRAMLCMPCVGAKHTLPIPRYAGTLPFRERFGYWLRVWRRYLCGKITKEKRDLLLQDFSLLVQGKPLGKGKRNHKLYDTIAKETNGACVYCGKPLSRTGVTYDHILPKSFGGNRKPENIILCCGDCNSRKSNLSVDEFVKTFPESQRRRYANRVHGLVKEKHLSKEKATLLLSFENEHRRSIRFRLFRRIITVTFAQQRVRL